VHRMTDEPVTPPELEQGLREILADLKGEPRPEPLRLVAGEPIPAAMPPDVLADLFEMGEIGTINASPPCVMLSAELANDTLRELERTRRILIVDGHGMSAAAMIANLREREIPAIDAGRALHEAFERGEITLPPLAYVDEIPQPRTKRVTAVRVRKGKKR
jgi:hypothetical protein